MVHRQKGNISNTLSVGAMSGHHRPRSPSIFRWKHRILPISFKGIPTQNPSERASECALHQIGRWLVRCHQILDASQCRHDCISDGNPSCFWCPFSWVFSLKINGKNANIGRRFLRHSPHHIRWQNTEERNAWCSCSDSQRNVLSFGLHGIRQSVLQWHSQIFLRELFKWTSPRCQHEDRSLFLIPELLKLEQALKVSNIQTVSVCMDAQQIQEQRLLIKNRGHFFIS